MTAPARWFALAAAPVLVTALVLAGARGREPHAARPASAPAPPPERALRIARRFLTVYVSAYARPLDASERAELRRIAEPGIVEVLVGQPPEERRPGGRVASIHLTEIGASGWLAVGSLVFPGLRTPAALVVASDGGGGWRVDDFEPGSNEAWAALRPPTRDPSLEVP
jgi:hypothetical protein